MKQAAISSKDVPVSRDARQTLLRGGLLAQVAVEGSGAAGEGAAATWRDQIPVDLILMIGGGVVGLYVFVALIRAFTSVSKRGVGLPRSVRQQIKKSEDAGNFAGAADLLFQHERYEEAAEVYEHSGDLIRAAEALEKGGNTAKAVQMYRRGGAQPLAAEAYMRRGQFTLAGKEFQAAGVMDRAAECFLKGSDYRHAAEIFRELGKHKEAFECYEKAGDAATAATLQLRYFDSQYEMARGDLRQIPEAREAAQRVAEGWAAAGKTVEAAELFQRAGFRRRAAELFEQAGRIKEAAQIYLEANKPMEAARLYDSIGETKQARKYRAEARLATGDKMGAAADYGAAEDYAKAAELYNELQEPGLAAQMFEKLGDFRMAADLFRSCGDMQSSARASEQAADYDAAAAIYRDLGDHRAELRVAKSGNNYYRVGEILLEHNRQEDALAAFQRVEATDARAAAANVVQGDILRGLGRTELALAKYKAAVDGSPPSKGNIETWYKIAETAEEAGQVQEALRVFEVVVGVDYYFRDASKRAGALRERGGADNAFAERPATGVGGVPRGLEASTARRYEIQEEIARGGMGIVYKAFDTVLERVVAYKILSANLKENEVAVKYFLREARAAAKMAHPNIVTVFDAGEQDGEFYMAMEYVEGSTLKQYVTRQGAFTERTVRSIMGQVCRGLTYAHDRGLVHRDIKPGNLMLSRDRVVKIMDFGLAKFVEEVNANHTRAIGTPYYMSPEQIVGKELDGRSDIYSLGVSMFECATGQVPFGKGDLSYHHLHTDPPRVIDLNPAISEEFSQVIYKCMAKAPDDRYRSVAELMATLREG